MPVPNEPWRLDAHEALPLMLNGELKVVDYAKSLILRIQRRDQNVKAWVWLNPSQILQQAKVLDELPASERGPLHGLPIGVKDIILTKDQPTQYNSKLYESEIPINTDVRIYTGQTLPLPQTSLTLIPFCIRLT